MAQMLPQSEFICIIFDQSKLWLNMEKKTRFFCIPIILEHRQFGHSAKTMLKFGRGLINLAEVLTMVKF